MRYNMKMSAALVGVMLLALPMASAFANTFLPDKTMELYKGETGEYCVYLQNTGEEDVIQAIRVFEGEEYIKNMRDVDKNFDVLVGTVSDDLPVCMKVKLPRGSEKGEKYGITYGIKGVSADYQEGMVSIAPIQIKETFYLTERLDKKPISGTKYILSGLAILAVLTLGGYFYRRRRLKKIVVQ